MAPASSLGRSSLSLRPNPTSSLTSLPISDCWRRLPARPSRSTRVFLHGRPAPRVYTSNLRFVSTLDPSSGGQPAFGARNTTLVLRQYLPALNFSLELSLGPRRCTGILSCVHWACYAPAGGLLPSALCFAAPRLLFSSLHTCLVPTSSATIPIPARRTRPCSCSGALKATK